MVDAANLETRLSIEPPAPPPADRSDESRRGEATQGFRQTPGDTPIPAADSVDLSDAAQAIGPIPEVTANAGAAEIPSSDREDDDSRRNDAGVSAPSETAGPPPANNGVAAQPSLQTAATDPITPGADDPLETNQISSVALEEAGNDTLNETEAGRTLGQVIDVFA